MIPEFAFYIDTEIEWRSWRDLVVLILGRIVPPPGSAGVSTLMHDRSTTGA